VVDFKKRSAIKL
jgi:ribonuclease HI